MDGDDPIRQAPPSAKLVYVVLNHEAPLTQQALADATRLSPRTIRAAVHRLEQLDIVETRRDWLDARRRLYTLQGDQ